MSLIAFLGLMLTVLAGLAVLGVVTVYPAASREQRISQMSTGSVTVSFIATTNTSTALTAIAAGARVVPGATITGPDIPAATHIVSYDFAAHTAVLSQAATGSHAGGTYVQADPLDAGYNGKNFRLFKTAYAPQVSTLLSDLTPIEADYNGYAPIALSQTLGYVDPSGNAISQSQLLSFSPSDALNPNQIYGWWIDDGTNVLMAGSLAAPVTLDKPTKELAIVLQDSFPPSASIIQVVP